MGRDAWRRLQAQTNMQSNRQQAGANFASDPLLLAMHLGDEYTRESRRADEAAENVARQPAAPHVRWESFRWLDATNGLVLIADLPQDVTSCNLDVQTLSLTSPSSMSLTLTLLETKTAGAWIKSRMATPHQAEDSRWSERAFLPKHDRVAPGHAVHEADGSRRARDEHRSELYANLQAVERCRDHRV